MSDEMENTVKQFEYVRSSKYMDMDRVYTECSGPGGLQLTEFMAEKMQLRRAARLLDIGIEHGYQTCFLAREYDVFVIAIDPDDDRLDGIPHVEHLQRNAHIWEVADRVVGPKLGVPDTRFAANTFDYVHSTTTLEMVRGLFGVEYYRLCLAEIYRVLRPGGIFGLGEPMHLDVPIPADLSPIYTKGGGVGPEGWSRCFATVAETASLCHDAGFTILEADYAPDAWNWCNQFTLNDPHCQADPEGEPRVIQQDAGRWLSYGYVIAQKPLRVTLDG
jgi:cyclopropane fatty-acyl-phospholipid synthase-like methyltransferase